MASKGGSYAPKNGEWSTSLFGCMNDCNSCCLTMWCPCITVGRIAEITDRGTTSCCTSASVYVMLSLLLFRPARSIYSCFYRSKLRNNYNLNQSSDCGDCCFHWFCHECALCQEYRELQNRGFDMSLGWHGNMDKQQNRGVGLAPAVEGGMTR